MVTVRERARSTRPEWATYVNCFLAAAAAAAERADDLGDGLEEVRTREAAELLQCEQKF